MMRTSLIILLLLFSTSVALTQESNSKEKPGDQEKSSSKEPAANQPIPKAVLGNEDFKKDQFVRLHATQKMVATNSIDETKQVFTVTTYYRNGNRLVPRTNEIIVVKLPRKGLKQGQPPRLKHWYFQGTDEIVEYNSKHYRVLKHPSLKEITEDGKRIAITDSNRLTRFVKVVAFNKEGAKFKELSDGSTFALGKKQMSTKTLSALRKWAKQPKGDVKDEAKEKGSQ